MNFYEVTLNGSCNGQAVKNILYYRTGVGIDLTNVGLSAAPDLAYQVKQEVWPAWKQCVHNQYVLENIGVTVLNDLFEFVYHTPYYLDVRDNGAQGDDNLGAGSCVNLHFVFESMALGGLANGGKPPKRGYVAIGPISEGMITGGRLMGSWWPLSGPLSHFQNLADKLVANLENLIPPLIFYPIRAAKVRGLLGIGQWNAWADMKGARLDTRLHIRKSRMPEA